MVPVSQNFWSCKLEPKLLGDLTSHTYANSPHMQEILDGVKKLKAVKNDARQQPSISKPIHSSSAHPMLCDLSLDAGSKFLKALDSFTVEAVDHLVNNKFDHIYINITTKWNGQSIITPGNVYQSSNNSVVAEPGCIGKVLLTFSIGNDGFDGAKLKIVDKHLQAVMIDVSDGSTYFTLILNHHSSEQSIEVTAPRSGNILTLMLSVIMKSNLVEQPIMNSFEKFLQEVNYIEKLLDSVDISLRYPVESDDGYFSCLYVALSQITEIDHISSSNHHISLPNDENERLLLLSFLTDYYVLVVQVEAQYYDPLTNLFSILVGNILYDGLNGLSKSFTNQTIQVLPLIFPTKVKDSTSSDVSRMLPEYGAVLVPKLLFHMLFSKELSTGIEIVYQHSSKVKSSCSPSMKIRLMKDVKTVAYIFCQQASSNMFFNQLDIVIWLLDTCENLEMKEEINLIITSVFSHFIQTFHQEENSSNCKNGQEQVAISVRYFRMLHTLVRYSALIEKKDITCEIERELIKCLDACLKSKLSFEFTNDLAKTNDCLAFATYLFDHGEKFSRDDNMSCAFLNLALNMKSWNHLTKFYKIATSRNSEIFDSLLEISVTKLSNQLEKKPENNKTIRKQARDKIAPLLALKLFSWETNSTSIPSFPMPIKNILDSISAEHLAVIVAILLKWDKTGLKSEGKCLEIVTKFIFSILHYLPNKVINFPASSGVWAQMANCFAFQSYDSNVFVEKVIGLLQKFKSRRSKIQLFQIPLRILTSSLGLKSSGQPKQSLLKEKLVDELMELIISNLGAHVKKQDSSKKRTPNIFKEIVSCVQTLNCYPDDIKRFANNNRFKERIQELCQNLLALGLKPLLCSNEDIERKVNSRSKKKSKVPNTFQLLKLPSVCFEPAPKKVKHEVIVID